MQQSAGAMDEAFRVGVEQGRRFKGLHERQAEGMVGRLRCRWAGFSSTEKLDEKKHGNVMILPLLLGLPNSVSSASANEFDTNWPRNRRDLNEIGIASSDAVGRGISFEGAFSDASGGLGYENSGLRATKLGRGRLFF